MLFTFVADIASSMFRCVVRLWSQESPQRIDGPFEISSLLQTGSARPTHSHNVSPRHVRGSAAQPSGTHAAHYTHCSAASSSAFRCKLLSAGGVRHEPQQGQRQQRRQRAHLQGAPRLSLRIPNRHQTIARSMAAFPVTLLEEPRFLCRGREGQIAGNSLQQGAPAG